MSISFLLSFLVTTGGFYTTTRPMGHQQ